MASAASGPIRFVNYMCRVKLKAEASVRAELHLSSPARVLEDEVELLE